VYSGNTVLWRPSINFLGLIELNLCELSVPAGVTSVFRDFNSVCFLPGDTFDIGQVSAGPETGVSYTTYMDVGP